MVKIMKTRIGHYKGARIRLESGEILTSSDLLSLDNDIVNLVIDAGVYDPVNGGQRVDISVLSEMSLPIVSLTIGGQFIDTLPDLSGWTDLSSLTVMNTSIESIDVSDLNLTRLTLDSNPNLLTIDPSISYMSSLQSLELIEMPQQDLSFITEDNTLHVLRTVYVVDMYNMDELPRQLYYISSLESLYIDRSIFTVSDEDIDSLLDRTSLKYLSLSPDQIDFDVNHVEEDSDVTVDVQSNSTYG